MPENCPNKGSYRDGAEQLRDEGGTLHDIAVREATEAGYTINLEPEPVDVHEPGRQ